MSEYTCKMCGGVFEEGQTQQEAEEEYLGNFGQKVFATAKRVTICHECYLAILPYIQTFDKDGYKGDEDHRSDHRDDSLSN